MGADGVDLTLVMQHGVMSSFQYFLESFAKTAATDPVPTIGLDSLISIE